MKKTSVSQMQIIRTIVLAIVFLSLTCLLYIGFREDSNLTTASQKLLYSFGFGALLAGLVTLLMSVQLNDGQSSPKKWWFYPVMAGLLGLGCMSLAYMYLGVWPIGDRSVMIVDMHHQYAPLLAQLRDMLLHGGNFLYSFDIGLGTNLMPLFAYYLSSPFNLLLVFFPEHLLTEGILVITLLKNALCAYFFALCVQYIYRRRDYSVIIVSIMYSMMIYLIAYSWNIMWLDCVMVLPLVVMNFEKLMRTGKYLPYVLTLAYALYANYYIGFMLCLFLVLYFFCYSLRQVRTVETRRRSFGRFAIGSLLGGGLVMFLLVPVYIGLKLTSAAGGTLPDMANNFDIFELLGRNLYGTAPTIRSGNLPNIYCGMLAVFMLPLYATMKSIPLRRRVSYMALLGVMAASLVLNQLDLIWHGLHTPNDLPYRYSFIYSFVLLLIAYEALIHIREIRFKQVAGSFLGILVYLVIEEHFGSDDYSFDTIYISLLLVIIYAAVTTLISKKRVALRTGYCLLLLVVTAEMTLGAGYTFKKLNSQEYFTAHKDYVDNDITETIQKAVDRTEEIGDAAAAEEDNAFYRLEFLPRRTTVDTALYDYRGLTVFASSNSVKMTKFMGYLGYAINGVNSYLYKSFVPTTDSLLGIKYVILNSNISSHAQLTKLDQAQVGSSGTYYIYENSTALSLGYFVDSSVKTWTPSKYNPIATQNSLFASMTGISDEMFTTGTVTVDSSSSSIASASGSTNFSVNPGSTKQTARFVVTAARSGQGYIYVDCSAADSISISCNGNSWSSSPSEPYIIDAGTLDAGDTVTVSVTSDSSCSGNIYLSTLNADVFDKTIDKLSANQLSVSSFSDTKITGTVTAPEDGTIFTSIPYDKGWTVKVDGVKVETYAVGEAMLSFDVGAGEHTVVMSFLTVGLLPGILISIVSLAALVALLLFIQKKVRHNDPEDDEFAAFNRLLSQPDIEAAIIEKDVEGSESEAPAAPLWESGRELEDAPVASDPIGYTDKPAGALDTDESKPEDTERGDGGAED